MTIYKKIAEVMKDVKYLQKDGNIEFKSTKYKAISEEKVTQAVRESLIKNGLVIIPIEQEHSKAGELTTVNVKYKIIDIDTGDFEILVSSGTGQDYGDKGVGKAMTYSYKYMLLRTFAIPTGEDPDMVHHVEDKKIENAMERVTNINQKSKKKKSEEVSEELAPINEPTITPEKVTALFELAKEKNLTEAQVLAGLKKYHKKTAPEQLTDKEYTETIKLIKAVGDK